LGWIEKYEGKDVILPDKTKTLKMQINRFGYYHRITQGKVLYNFNIIMENSYNNFLLYHKNLYFCGQKTTVP